MTPEQRGCFQDHGLLSLPGFYRSAALEPLRAQVLAEAARLRTRSARKAHASLPVFSQSGELSRRIRIPDLRHRIISDDLVAAMRALAGCPLVPGDDAQLLLSLPRTVGPADEVPAWHVDIKADPPDRLPGIQAFVLIDDVVPGGGATRALAGSHRIAAASKPRPDLRGLPSAGAERVRALARFGLDEVEMAGRAGDVFLMDLRVLHAPSPNMSKRMRIMATSRWFVSSLEPDRRPAERR
ncbi:MAG: phytanoyl-CoA dioxygenase family protein [Lautropia sp.]